MANILVVEDNDQVRFALSALLKDSGHTVAEAQNGETALDMVSEDRFDVVVTDVFMSRVDGIELLRALRADCPDLKIMVMSGGGNLFHPIVALDLACKLGADAVMQKPVDNDAFLARIEALAEGARA